MFDNGAGIPIVRVGERLLLAVRTTRHDELPERLPVGIAGRRREEALTAIALERATRVDGGPPLPREGTPGARRHRLVERRASHAPGPVVLHTDGVDRFPGDTPTGASVGALPERIMDEHGVGRDDMDVAVIHRAAPEDRP